MLTLQNLLESDSLSTIVAKLNNNFQVISLAGGGPSGKPGDQGIPGLPGKQGVTGPSGAVGPTGLSTYMIPFATGTSGNTGPSTVSGPWPVASLDYLTSTIGTGGTGDIYVDHYNKGYWMYLSAADGTGQYSNVGPAYPPTGTGYFGGAGWYFYPQPETVDLTNVWTYDYSTYFTFPPYATGPFDSDNSPLKIPNARFNSKYGTVWISAGNSGTTGQNEYNTSEIDSWGSNYGSIALPQPQPGRWNAGVDRLLFKFSLDSLPYSSVITARSTTQLNQPANAASSTFPTIDNSGLYPIIGDGYWVKPIYDASLDEYTPLFFWSELRPTGDGEDRFGTLGLYQYTASNASSYGTTAGAGVTAGSTANILFWNSKKSAYLMSTRLAPSPEDYENMGTGANGEINAQRTLNNSDFVFDVKSLVSTNQVVSLLPTDLKLSSDYVNSSGGGYTYREGSSNYPYKVFGGFISSANGKSLAADINFANYIDFGSGIGNSPDSFTVNEGNQTRRFWYGSAFRFDDITTWSTGSSDPLSEGYVRLAGMTERGKKTWNSGNDTYFLSELIFYTSQFEVSSGSLSDVTSHSISSQDIDWANNQQRSLPSFYVSPFRNLGIGTFTNDDLGVWEPQARLHAHVNPAKISGGGLDPSDVYTSLGTMSGTNPLIINPSVTKVAAFTADATTGNTGFIDFYLGRKTVPDYENANPYNGGDPITSPTGNFRISFRREGWYNNTDLDSFRLGVIPGSTGSDIGESLNSYANEFQFALHPLNTNATDIGDEASAITGVGIHNLWPRSRFHVFGKNKYNEADRGEELAYPGPAIGASAITSYSFPYYPGNYKSNSQVVTDYIGDSYLYPTGIYEYDYIAWGAALGGNQFVSPGVTALGVQFSPNSSAYPSREILSPTRHSIPYGTTGDSGALYGPYWLPGYTGVTGITGAFNESYRHGGITGASYKPTHYVGFNMFRDLMNVGDTKEDTNTWVIGTNGGLENGGSAILTNSEGDFAISSIKSQRSGGENYAIWEQKVSTRDVLNNIKVVIQKDGSVGFGNKAGYDPDAFSSQERNNSTGYLNYVPQVGTVAVVEGPYTAGYSTSYRYPYFGTTGAYGYVTYSGLPSSAQSESSSSSPASRINARATQGESFRAEFAGDKLHGRPGRTIQNQGYGYPASQTLTLSGATARKYIKFNSGYDPAPGGLQVSFTTDFEGRIILSRIYTGSAPSGVTSGTPIQDWVEALVFPHPTEFATGGPLNHVISGASWEPVIGSAPAAWSGTGSNSWVSGNPYFIDATFQADPLIQGNIRLNNFVVGEGLGYSGGNTASADAQAVKAARQESPKIVFTFMEADNSRVPGDTLTSAFTGKPQAGVTGYRKVNTVIASAQNESALREYWIPKADNTGGTFMVFTDHYGKKEKDTDGLDGTTISMNNLLIDQVVTLEYLVGYTGTPGANITSRATNEQWMSSDAKSGGNTGGSPITSRYPGYVTYSNAYTPEIALGMRGATGSTAGPFSTTGWASTQYGRIYQVAPGVTAEIELIQPGYNAEGGSKDLLSTGLTGGTIVRNVNKYYSLYNADSPVNGWNDSTFSGKDKTSAIRFQRINSDWVMIDFNLTVSVRNPNLDTGVAPGEQTAETAGYTATYATDLIDLGSPRWTQYLRFKYFPALSGAPVTTEAGRNEFLWNLFGNGLSFANWSSFKNWNAGWAVVGPTTSGGADGGSNWNPSNDGSPAFTFVTAAGSASRHNTWQGNLLNYGTAPVTSWTSSPTVTFVQRTGYGGTAGAGAGVDGTYIDTVDNGLDNKRFIWPLVARNLNMFYLDWTNTIPVWPSSSDRRQAYFSTYLGEMFQLLGNHAFSRTRACSWRIVPQYASTHGSGVDPGSFYAKRDSFMLEVMFDIPIMHHDVFLRKTGMGDATNQAANNGNDTGDINFYYKYLTISGQSILRFVNNAYYSYGGGLPG